MVSKLKWNLIVLLLSVLSKTLSAQVPSVGDSDAAGRVYAKVVVTIAGDAGGFGHPASGIRFLVVTESGDRISIRTNDAGVASTWVLPGSYRIVNPDPYELNGQSYTWDVVVPIQPGTGMIKLSQSNATKIIATVPSRSKPGSSISESTPMTNSSTAASISRSSVTEGFFIAPHLLGASIKVEDSQVESGGGGGLTLGFGVSRNVALFLNLDAAAIQSRDSDIGDSYVLAHADVGVRLNLADQLHKGVPYIQGAFTGHAAGRTVDGSDLIFSGVGGTGGVGLTYYTRPKVGLDIGLSYSFGNFSKLTIDSDDYPIDKLNLSGARFHVGATIFPFASERISP